MREYKQFFEQIENKKKLLSQKKMQFSEEENRRIIQKFNELKTILFNKDKNNKTTKVFSDEKKYVNLSDQEKIKDIFNKVISGQMNKNEINEKNIVTLIEHGKM